MKLMKELELPEFFKAVQQCNGEITYHTEEGDILNLKSKLSQYVFAAAFSSRTLRLDGDVEWEKDEDALLLQRFGESER